MTREMYFLSVCMYVYDYHNDNKCMYLTLTLIVILFTVCDRVALKLDLWLFCFENTENFSWFPHGLLSSAGYTQSRVFIK